MTGQQLVSIIIRQIEFELEKAGDGLGMPHDTERVARLRHMLREARKRKLSGGLAAKRRLTSDDR
jgi:hypothetical protein